MIVGIQSVLIKNAPSNWTEQKEIMITGNG